ncbi:MAG TPA: DUF4412 domain-containing protein [Cyclobacteriaceae bacterium]|nr:DUF4412 domain-containing protein [Cyclobacteriaceae bacterium]
MKAWLAIVCSLCISIGHAQSFEGTIRWKISLDITNPQVLANIEQTKKEQQDSSSKIKAREIREKMADPEVARKLKADPELKKKMEAMLQVLEGAGVDDLLPKSIEVKLKNKNSLTTVSGGPYNNYQVLYKADKDLTYFIRHDEKTYSVIANATTVPTRKFGHKPEDKIKVLGYTCTKYFKAEMTDDLKSRMTIYWATDELKGIDIQTLAMRHMGKDKSFIYPEIPAFPMKIVQTLNEGDMTMEVIEINKGKLSPDVFEIPAGYVVR